MPEKGKLDKVVDDEHQVRCATGSYGLFREEVWVAAGRQIVRYNLAFIHHGLCLRDNGRVLGYDNAHGYHERHWMGHAQPIEFTSYEVLFAKFRAELDALRRQA